MRAALVLGLLVICSGPAQGQEANHQETELGAVNFNASCSTQEFDHALAFFHHMQYEESRAAFERIVGTDPECGMAHWGIAMTLFQPLWPTRPGPEALRRGWEEVQKAQDLGTGSDRDANLLSAAEAFFRDPETADWWTRIRSWSEAMDRAYRESPEDMETAALYALSQLAAGQVAPNRLAYHSRAAEVLLSLYEREPTHPGAIHYTIHANDVDTRATKSLEVVRSYAEIAPAVPHALHMPTHIFVRLGEWPDVIDWNRRAADAALRFPAPDGISNHYAHALDYLVYAYLQRGEDAQALAVIEEISAKDEPFQGTFTSAFHLAAMPARYAVERRAWSEALALTPRTPTSVKWDRFWWAESVSWFARGLGAAHTGDVSEAERSDRRMGELRNAARAGGEEGFANYIEIDRLLLAAWRAHVAGESQLALDLVGSAVQLESRTQKHPVTPGALWPSQEALGDLLLELGRAEEALSAYARSLATWPARFNSILGAARAARAANLEVQAQRHYRQLLEVSSKRDSRRPALKEAQEFLRAR
jgi:tetratricopeptide (TPR) repeat protein